jgi:hypothetical protein
MSAGITSCCTPCAAAPVTPQQPATTGGGAPMKDDAASGGGEVVGGGGDATTYEAAPEPAQCGQWVQAPVVVGGEQPTTAPSTAPADGGDTPPEPTPAAGSDAPAPTDAVATTPASQLATWPQWQQYFTRLGLGQDDVAKLGAANLTDQQLAQVYEHVHAGIVAAGGTPGVTPVPGSTASSAWDTEWEQRFASLGLPTELVGDIKAEAQRTGADDAKLQAVYDQLAAGGAGGTTGTSAWNAAWDQRFAALGLPADMVADIKAEAQRTGADDATIQRVYEQVAAKVQGGTTTPTGGTQGADASQPGWNAQFEQAFRSLGMPDDVIAIYAQSGAPASGLEKAYEHAKGRVADFTDRGWMKKFQDAGIPADQTWSLVLGPNAATDEQCEEVLKAHKKANESMLQKGAQLATSLFPGGRLLQYAFGKEFVSGDEIDRTNPMEIGMAALSGLAAFAAIRGGKNVLAGIKARNGGFAALNGVGSTLEGLGLPKGGVASMEQAAMGATQTWGFKQKLLSWIPGTSLHREVVGLGHAEAAARAFNGGAAAKILANDADGALQMATLTQVFDDIKSGAMRIQGGSNAYLALKKAPLMSLSSLKDGSQVIKVAKGLGIGNGNSQLVGLMQVGGTKLGQNPEWLAGATNLVDDIAQLSTQQRGTLGAVMAGNLAKDLAGSFSKDGIRSMRGLAKLASGHQPEWYTSLANATKSQWPANQIPKDVLELGTTSRLVGKLFGDARGAIGTVDRAALAPETATLVDDVAARMDDVEGAVKAGTSAGKLGDDYQTAFRAWQESVAKLAAKDEALATKLFAADDATITTMLREAQSATRAEWAATTAQAAGAVDDAARGAAVAASASGAPATASASAVADDLEAIRAMNLQRPVNEPVALRFNASGEAYTPSGLYVPGWTSPVGAAAPASVTDPSIARLAEAMQRMTRT